MLVSSVICSEYPSERATALVAPPFCMKRPQVHQKDTPAKVCQAPLLYCVQYGMISEGHRMKCQLRMQKEVRCCADKTPESLRV